MEKRDIDTWLCNTMPDVEIETVGQCECGFSCCANDDDTCENAYDPRKDENVRPDINLIDLLLEYSRHFENLRAVAMSVTDTRMRLYELIRDNMEKDKKGAPLTAADMELATDTADRFVRLIEDSID